MNSDHRLDRELETYKNMLPTLIGDEGRFALIAEDQLLGVFDTYADALSEGYKARGLETFLVKKISAVEVVSYFSRDYWTPNVPFHKCNQ